MQSQVGAAGFRQFRAAQPTPENRKVLLVADDPRGVAALDGVAEELQLQVVHCASAGDAAAQMRDHAFALILVDLEQRGGAEFAATPPVADTTGERQISVVFISGANGRQPVETGWPGLVDYLFKPVNRHLLVAKIKVLLELEARSRELELAYSLAYEHHLRQQLLLGAVGEGVLGIDQGGTVIYANAGAAGILGASVKMLTGRHIGDFCGRDNWTDSAIGEICRSPGSGGRDLEADFWRVDGEKIPVNYTCSSIGDFDDIRVGSVVVFRDMRQQQMAQERLLRAARYDAPTGLANRQMFYDFLAEVMARPDSTDVAPALLLIDIDNFKDINGTLGPTAGDQVLAEVARRIKELVKPGDLLARISGDEFALVAPAPGSPNGLAVLAGQITVAMAEVMTIDEQEVHTTCSIGIATLAEVEAEADELLKAAGLALKKAKVEGGNCHYFYNARLQKSKLQKLQIERRMRDFLVTGSFELYFQPLVDCGGGIVGAEALIRWPRDDDMMVGPDVFIPVAEDSGLIKAIGEWVLTTAVQALKGWLEDGLVRDPFRLAINISTIQLMDEHFHSSVKSVIDQFQLPARYLEFELTESAVMYEPSRVIQNLNKLHAMGITIAIDDFGTGYSSLSYLTRMPIDILKIDKCFVDGIGLITENEAVVRAVVAMGHNLDLSLVAEGVEKDAQRRFLMDNDCDYLQGYLFSRPLPENEFVAYLAEPVKTVQ